MLRLFLLLLLATLLPANLRAHEVPARVAVQAYVRPEGRVVRVLVRAPLEAMRDVEFPTRRGVYLDLARADSTLRDAARLWIADAIALQWRGVALTDARIVAVRASLPSDHAFERYDAALRQVQGAPLDPALEIPVPQVMLDVLLEYPVSATPTGAELSIDAHFARLGQRTSTVLRFVPVDGAERAYVYDGDPGPVPLDPRWWHAASRFVTMGATHLLDGIDHLLFLLCLVIPVRRLRPLVAIVTAFTVAHSLTLGVSALGYAPDALWFPPLVEVLIAASIVFMAVENMLDRSVEHRWMMAFGFGLIHGFGFSYALQESLQFAGAHLLTALAAFNVGIELAQLAVLAVMVPVLNTLLTRVLPGRAGPIILSAFITHTAWHWMTDRFETLQAYRIAWPDLPTASAALHATVVLGLIGAVAWALSRLMNRFLRVRAVAPLGLITVLAGGVASGMLAPRRAQAQGARTTLSGVYTAEQAKKGREVFTGFCAGCHTVASHSGPAFAARWAGHPLSEFFDYITRLMPKSAPGTLTEDEYVWVTAYVLKLNGLPASPRELSAEPTVLRAIRIELPAGGDRDEARQLRDPLAPHWRVAAAPRPFGRIPAGRTEKP